MDKIIHYRIPHLLKKLDLHFALSSCIWPEIVTIHKENLIHRAMALIFQLMAISSQFLGFIASV